VAAQQSLFGAAVVSTPAGPARTSFEPAPGGAVWAWSDQSGWHAFTVDQLTAAARKRTSR